MSSQASALGSVAVREPVMISEGQQFYWLVRRELWENRWVYLAPTAMAGLYLLGYSISVVRLASLMHAGSVPPERLFPLTQMAFGVAELLLMGVMILVAAFYCLEAMHGERKDRSILFWKSLPVSDWATVLSKLVIPVLGLPLVTFALTVATEMLMLMVRGMVTAGTGVGGVPAPLWSMSVMLLFHLVAIHGVWYAPIYAYLLMVSAWARRAALLWAVLPVVAIAFAEKLVGGTTYFGHMLGSRLAGPDVGVGFDPHAMQMGSIGGMHLGPYFYGPGLWAGLVVAGVFVWGAVRLRRERGPI